MKLLRSISIDKISYDVVISDEAEVLSKARDKGICSIAIDPDQSLDLSLSEFAAESLELVDDEFIKKAVYRKYGIPLTILTTNRLLLRELTCDDYDKIESSQALLEYERYFDNKEEFLSYIGFNYRFFDYGIWAIEDKYSRAFVGMAGLYNKGSLDLYYLSYFINPEYRNKGYAYEVSRAIIETVYKKIKVAIEIKKGNIISLKLAEKLAKYAKDMLKYSIDILYLDML